MKPLIRLSAPDTAESWEIPVLFEDEHLLAIDKPSRLLVSPDRYDPNRPNLMKLLHRDIERGAAWARERNITYLANAHRLDFETSGIVLLAKSRPVLVALADQFGSQQPRKTYVALTHGRSNHATFEVDVKLGPHPHRLGLMRPETKTGKKSLTRFEVIEQFRDCALMRCLPETGRTHQIRVHLQFRRLPIVGDADYGGRPLLLSRLKPGYRLKPGHTERPLLDRVALHAERLEVTHPITGAPVVIEAKWPKDFSVAVKYLRKFTPTGAARAAAEAGVEDGEAV
jgi:RluA family pseudouridine synthase